MESRSTGVEGQCLPHCRDGLFALACLQCDDAEEMVGIGAAWIGKDDMLIKILSLPQVSRLMML